MVSFRRSGLPRRFVQRWEMDAFSTVTRSVGKLPIEGFLNRDKSLCSLFTIGAPPISVLRIGCSSIWMLSRVSPPARVMRIRIASSSKRRVKLICSLSQPTLANRWISTTTSLWPSTSWTTYFEKRQAKPTSLLSGRTSIRIRRIVPHWDGESRP